MSNTTVGEGEGTALSIDSNQAGVRLRTSGLDVGTDSDIACQAVDEDAATIAGAGSIGSHGGDNLSDCALNQYRSAIALDVAGISMHRATDVGGTRSSTACDESRTRRDGGDVATITGAAAICIEFTGDSETGAAEIDCTAIAVCSVHGNIQVTGLIDIDATTEVDQGDRTAITGGADIAAAGIELAAPNTVRQAGRGGVNRERVD